ncbi:putative mediator of RNA polymerase II transcription subunit 26 isoform X2 [Rhineura floridana]|uniref:putative mediator of RNA polymerase II transcription subunit 26 isoform X2 n=1 Tax=Rhineura floridana TaxID=261503 RepID=UPI002AC81300|nr:putative mediator of RNA polymerase II transcription subunit 26 isoform X2 [Rhineura floridana]
MYLRIWHPKQDGSRACPTARRASNQTQKGSLESDLQALRSTSHPLASDFLQALQVAVQISAQTLAENQQLKSSLRAPNYNLLEANQQLRQKLNDQQDLVSHLPEENRQLQNSQEEQVSHLAEENRQLHEELNSQKERVSNLLEENRQLQNSQEEQVSHLAEENRQLHEELNSQKERVSNLLEENRQLQNSQEEQQAHLLKENRQLQQELKDQEDLVSQLLEENQQLQQAVNNQEFKVSHLLEENQWLRQEQMRSQRGTQKSVCQTLAPLAAVFPVQVWTTGHTGGCEKHFVDEVSKRLAGLGVALQLEDYQEESERFLLRFCPVVSRMGTDTIRALEGLNSVRKALLVVLHLKPKHSRQDIVDTKRQVQHGALVRTLHACYSIQDGFYACEMNKAALASAVEATNEFCCRI